MNLTKVKTKYNLKSLGLLLCFILFLASISILKLINIDWSGANYSQFWTQNKDLRLIYLMLGIQLIFLILFMKNYRLIKIKQDGIIYINPLIPFIRSYRKWSYYDDHKKVMERGRYGSYEAIWLLRNGKLKDRISSVSYLNFEELRRNIGVKYSGELIINPFQQFLYITGFPLKLIND